MTTTGHLAMGTQGYMAPEILRGEEATPAADVYSLGVAFFRLLTNVWYDLCLAPSADRKSSIGMNSVKLLEPFEYRWVDVLPVMLNENPTDRPLDLKSLLDYLPPAQVEAPKKSRRGIWGAVLVVTLLVVGGVACWWLLRNTPKTISVDDLYAIPSAAQSE